MNTTIQNATRSGVFNLTQKLIGALTVGVLFVIPVLSPGAAKAALLTDLPTMSALNPFATFGNVYIDSNVTINGDVGISAGGKLNLMDPSTINGNLYLATGASVTGHPENVTGLTFNNQNLTAAQNQVFSASLALKNLTFNQSLGDVVVPGAGVSYGSANGVADVIVINMDNLKTGGGDITFVGDLGDYFVLNISHKLDMTGDAQIIGGAPGHLLVNLWDNTPENLGVVAHVGDVINGTTLIPYDAATFHSVNGAIYSGDGKITLMSGATVEYVPFEPPPPPTPIPEPTTFIAGALLLLPFGASTLRILRRKATA